MRAPRCEPCCVALSLQHPQLSLGPGARQLLPAGRLHLQLSRTCLTRPLWMRKTVVPWQICLSPTPSRRLRQRIWISSGIIKMQLLPGRGNTLKQHSFVGSNPPRSQNHRRRIRSWGCSSCSCRICSNMCNRRQRRRAATARKVIQQGNNQQCRSSHRGSHM